MAYNKVIYDNKTLMDLTADTVAPEVLLAGYTAHNCKGEMITGTAESGGGLPYVTELYSNDAMSISYTSSSAGTAKTISGITGICNYPFVIVYIEAVDTSLSSGKFMRSCTSMTNTKFATGGATVTRYGSMQYCNTSGALVNYSGSSYGLWGYTYTTAGTLTLRARCNGTYAVSLVGTYKIRVFGVIM